MSTLIVASGMTPTYTTGVPSADIGVLRDIASISSLAFWGRADDINAAPGGGYAWQFNDKRASSSRTLRQPTGQTGTLTQRTDTGYLGGKKTIEASSGSDTRLDLSDNVLSTTGPFAIYFAIHPLTTLCRVAGNTSASSLALNLVNSEIRLSVASSGSGASVIATASGGNLSGRNVLIGILRRTDSTSNRLVIRHKFAGSAWVETAASAYCTSDGLVGGTLRTIAATLSVGVYTAGSGYSLQSRLGQVAVFTSDLGTTNQTLVEDYLSDYHGMS